MHFIRRKQCNETNANTLFKKSFEIRNVVVCCNLHPRLHIYVRFDLNASAGHWKRTGGQHVARGPDPHASFQRPTRSEHIVVNSIVKTAGIKTNRKNKFTAIRAAQKTLLKNVDFVLKSTSVKPPVEKRGLQVLACTGH